MRTTTASKTTTLVDAIDIESNAVVHVPKRETIEIDVPESVDNPYGGDGTPVTPASLRIFRQPAPTRLVRIEPALHNRSRPWPVVVYRCKRFVRYEFAGRKHYGVQGSVYVRHERDARDPLFNALTGAERAKILSAVSKQEARS